MLSLTGTHNLDSFMLAFVSSPATMPRFRTGRDAAAALNPGWVTDVIWGLHSILVDSASTPFEAKNARQRMLKVLEETKDLYHPHMIVPPLTIPREAAQDQAERRSLPESDRVCGTCKRPVAPKLRRRSSFTRRPRASSSWAPRTTKREAGSETAFSHSVPANLAASR